MTNTTIIRIENLRGFIQASGGIAQDECDSRQPIDSELVKKALSEGCYKNIALFNNRLNLSSSIRKVSFNEYQTTGQN